MKHLFLPYEQALALKKLGFDEECLGEWQTLKTGNNLVIDEDDTIYDIPILAAETGAPTHQQATDWLREKHNIHVEVERSIDGWRYTITEFRNGNKFVKGGKEEMPDHNEELVKAIDEALKLIPCLCLRG